MKAEKTGAAIASDRVAVEIDGRGARIASIVDRRTATEFLLVTPWGDAPSRAEPYPAGSSPEWHRCYPGGWHTLVPHAGDERVVDGIGHPFHGEAAWRTWHEIERTATSCTHGVELESVPVDATRTVAVAGDTVTVVQRLRNRGDGPVSLTWTEHPAFGPAVVSPRSTVRVGDADAGIEFPPEGSGLSAFRTLAATGDAEASIANPDTGAFVRLRWDARLMPHLHVWQEHNASDGIPWWRRISAIALEPASRGYWPDGPELGPVLLAAGEELEARFELAVGVRSV
jgi:galactose mutarotase-like enzyme